MNMNVNALVNVVMNMNVNALVNVVTNMNASDVHVFVYRWCTRSTQWHMMLCCISAMVDGTSALRDIVNS